MYWRGSWCRARARPARGSSSGGSRPKSRWKRPRCSSGAGRSSSSPDSGNESGSAGPLRARCQRARPDLDSACIPPTVPGPAQAPWCTASFASHSAASGLADGAQRVGGGDLVLQRPCPRPVGVAGEHPAHGAAHHGRRGPAGVQVDAGAGPLHAGRHLGLVLAVARHHERDAVGQRLLHPAVAAVGDHDVDVGQQEVVGDEALQAHVRRQAAPQRLGVGPAGGGDDQHVVVRQGPGGQEQQPAQVGVVERALGDVDDRAAAASSPHHDGCSKDLRRRGQDRPDEAHRRARGPSAGTRSRPPSPAGRRRPPWAAGR